MKEWKILNLKYGSHSQVQTYFNSNVVSLLAETIPRPHFQFLYLRPNHIFFIYLFIITDVVCFNTYILKLFNLMVIDKPPIFY